MTDSGDSCRTRTDSWGYKQSLRKNFVERMVKEIRRKGVLVLRIYVSGDFYSEQYAGKWLEIMRQCPRVRFYLYTRSWRDPAIAEVLEKMAALRCCRIWYSIDGQTGVPQCVPVGVRLAYLQITEDEQPVCHDLLFVVKRLKKHAQRFRLPLLCDHQAEKRENCGECGKCFR